MILGLVLIGMELTGMLSDEHHMHDKAVKKHLSQYGCGFVSVSHLSFEEETEDHAMDQPYVGEYPHPRLVPHDDAAAAGGFDESDWVYAYRTDDDRHILIHVWTEDTVHVMDDFAEHLRSFYGRRHGRFDMEGTTVDDAVAHVREVLSEYGQTAAEYGLKGSELKPLRFSFYRSDGFIGDVEASWDMDRLRSDIVNLYEGA